MKAPGTDQFYVAFNCCGLRYLAIVTARLQPAKFEFETYQELHDAMDSLAEPWTLKGETPDPEQYRFDDCTVWEKQLAEVKAIVLAGRL